MEGEAKKRIKIDYGTGRMAISVPARYSVAATCAEAQIKIGSLLGKRSIKTLALPDDCELDTDACISEVVNDEILQPIFLPDCTGVGSTYRIDGVACMVSTDDNKIASSVADAKKLQGTVGQNEFERQDLEELRRVQAPEKKVLADTGGAGTGSVLQGSGPAKRRRSPSRGGVSKTEVASTHGPFAGRKKGGVVMSYALLVLMVAVAWLWLLQPPCSMSGARGENLFGCHCVEGYEPKKFHWLQNFLDGISIPVHPLMASLGACQACSPGSHSVTGSRCELCPRGRYQAYNAKTHCGQCEAGKFQDTRGSTTCKHCHPHSASPRGSGDVSACVCIEGFTKKGNACGPCARGTYKSTPGDGKCKPCPHLKTSSIGSSRLKDCSCKPGYSMGAGAECIMTASWVETFWTKHRDIDPMNLNVVFRDFQNSHADFELSGSQYSQGVDKTIVEPRLGEDGKPVLLLQGMKSRSVSSGESFAQWFTDVPGVNIRFDDTLKLQPTGNGRKFRFCSSDFFPLDNREGWPLVARERELGHKFWFTTEVSSTFIYRGNEEFFFSGDDDFWVFIGGQIAIDLGGLHPPASETLRLDEFPYRHEEGTLGLKLGEEYSIDIFHAERHTDKSNFCMETNIDFDGTLMSVSPPENRGEGTFERISVSLFGNLLGETSSWIFQNDCRFDDDRSRLLATNDRHRLKENLQHFLLAYHPDKISHNSPRCDKTVIARKFREFTEKDLKILRKRLKTGQPEYG